VRGIRFERAKTPISDKVQYVFTELQNYSEANYAVQATSNARLSLVLCDQLTYTSAHAEASRTPLATPARGA